MSIRPWRIALILLASGFTSASPLIAQDGNSVFEVKPYLQLGDHPTAGSGDLRLLWHTKDVDAGWSVEFRPSLGQDWKTSAAPKWRRIALAGVPAHRVYRVDLEGLVAGGTFAYRVSRDGKVVFEAEGKARKSADQPYRFVAVGDIAQGTVPQRAVAYQMVQAKPDFVMITGDIVYARGRISEYREKYWPVYNADEASPTVGGPLLRSVLTIAAPGNHDILSRDFAPVSRCPRLLLLLGPAAERAGTDPVQPHAGRAGGEPQGLPRRERLGLSPDGELLVRLWQRPLACPRRQPVRQLA